MLAAKADVLSSVPRIHREGENITTQIVLSLHIHAVMLICEHMYAKYTNIIIVKRSYL